MRTASLAALIFALAATAPGASRHCAFRVHTAANARDGNVFAQPIRSLSGRNVFIERTAWLTERDVHSFYPYQAADGSYGALLQLDDHGRTVLDTLSVEHRGSCSLSLLWPAADRVAGRSTGLRWQNLPRRLASPKPTSG